MWFKRVQYHGPLGWSIDPWLRNNGKNIWHNLYLRLLFSCVSLEHEDFVGRVVQGGGEALAFAQQVVDPLLQIVFPPSHQNDLEINIFYGTVTQMIWQYLIWKAFRIIYGNIVSKSDVRMKIMISYNIRHQNNQKMLWIKFYIIFFTCIYNDTEFHKRELTRWNERKIHSLSHTLQQRERERERVSEKTRNQSSKVFVANQIFSPFSSYKLTS